MTSPAVTRHARRALRAPGATHDHLLREGILKLLAIKDSDIRLLTLEQCRDAVDKSLHAGGAFSATIPLVTLYYGGFIDVDVADPTRPGQDLFVLSKGHAVAALASIYAELGYIDRSRPAQLAIVREHPERTSGADSSGHPDRDRSDGAGVGGGAGLRASPAASRRVSMRTALCGDGEMQEGPIWEAVMFAGQKHLDNLCVMVDRNNGQLDMANRMIFPMPDLEARLPIVQLGSAQRGRHAVQRHLCGARAVPLRPAQRQAHRDHLPRHEGPRRALGLPEQAQGHGAGSRCSSRRWRSRPISAAIGSANSRRSTTASRLSRRRAVAGGAGGLCGPDAPRRAPHIGRGVVARRGRRPGR